LTVLEKILLFFIEFTVRFSHKEHKGTKITKRNQGDSTMYA